MNPRRPAARTALLVALLAAALAASLLGGCASAPPPAVPVPVQLLDDAGYIAPADKDDTASLFELSPAMREYLHSPGFTSLLRERGPVRGLIDALYSKGQLRIDYDASETRPAAATFAARRGNCLSLVIMTAAFAKALNLDVQFQNVLVDQTWSRSGTLYLASLHVNLTVGRRSVDMLHSYDANQSLMIDFLPPEDMAGYRTAPIDEATVRAMYLNNRAAEALAAGQIDRAYWWARAAVTRFPAFGTAYNTLGVIHQRHGSSALAERSLRAALEREPDNLAAMQNLIPVLRQQGKEGEARALAARAAALQPEPAFYFFNLGQQAMARRDFSSARALFARETRRAPYYHEFHFWLAVADFQLGDTRAARDEMQRAFDTSTTTDSRNRYAAKLSHLRELARR